MTVFRHLAPVLMGASLACTDAAAPPEAIRIVAASATTLQVDESVQLSARWPEGSRSSIPAVTSWESSDTTRLEVDATGLAVARFPGVVTVTARSASGRGTLAMRVAPVEISWSGIGRVSERWTAEVNVRGAYAYTTTWGTRTVGGVPIIGNAINVWDVRGLAPALVDSVIVTDDAPAVAQPSPAAPMRANAEERVVSTLGDLQVSDDGTLLVVATERVPGSLLVFSLADPAHPRLVARHRTRNTASGVHTAELARVRGRLYAFLSVDPAANDTLPGPQLVIVDLSVPSAPAEVLVRRLGSPTIHDVFVRDGTLFTAEWNGGVRFWDVGGARGGSIANPLEFARVTIPGGAAHNAWWVHDSTTGSKRWLLVGQEQGGFDPGASEGDVHVVDVRDMTAPRVVGFYHLDGAGAHNFSVDERKGVLYAAYYNGGVRALDVRGDLSACSSAERSPDGRCDLGKMGRDVARFTMSEPIYVWGVQHVGNTLYASDMLNGLWKLDVSRIRR